MENIDEQIKAAEEIAKAVETPLTSLDGEVEFEEWVFTNDKTNPGLLYLNRMLHESAFRNKLGVMHARDKTDGKIKTLIVGVELTPDGPITWPIAKVLTEEEQGIFEGPDGNGNYA